MNYYDKKLKDRQIMADWSCWVALAFCLIMLAYAAWVGISKETDRQERIYYDKELGRMVYGSGQ